VRSVVAELGARLGCGAHLTELRRTRSGAFGLDRACSLERIESEGVPAHRLISLADAVGHLPAFPLVGDGLRAAATGRPVAWGELSDQPQPPGIVRFLAPSGALVALAQVDPGGRVAYARVFTSRLT
jgi:tRNA pseudouridine55 synthase